MSKYVVKNTENCTLITYGNRTRIKIFEIIPGILFAFNEIHSESLPLMTWNSDDCICTINYAIRGTCSLLSSNSNYICLRGDQMMISTEQPVNGFEYPTGNYFGLEIFIMKEANEGNILLEQFQIDLHNMLSVFFSSCSHTVIAENLSTIKNTFADIVSLYQKNILDIHLLRLHTLYLLRVLSVGIIQTRPGNAGALTRHQISLARRAERMITENLSARITISSMAAGMGISSTSLKNYFRSVYGKTISDYLKEKRMYKAKQLLTSTDLSILEISNRVGYESQSKFTASFHAYFGITPTAMRKMAPSELYRY